MTTASEIREYFSAYVVGDAELARRLADAPPSVHRALVVWIIEERLGAFPYSPKITPLLKRRLAGEEVPVAEWEDAAPPPFEPGSSSLHQSEALQQGYAEDAAWAARKDHLIGVAQMGGLIMMEKAADTRDAREAASDAFNAGFRTKLLELLGR